MAHSRVLICGLLAALSLSSSATAASPETETFSGTCEMSGVIRHQPPLTHEPTPTRFHGSFRGVCSGTLTDADGETRQLTAEPARYDGRGGGELSCGVGIAYGTGELIFRGGDRIEFSLTERRSPGAAVVTLEGDGGGAATVLGTLSRDEDLNELNERCDGPGIRFLRGDARILSPGLSG